MTRVEVGVLLLALSVAFGAYRYLCYLYARGDAKDVPGGGSWWNQYGQRPRG